MNILQTPWTLIINNSAAEKYQPISPTDLQNVTSITITYDLHGLMLRDGNASAIIFDQDGWKYVSLSKYGVNGKNGEQTVTIPIADFGLDLTKPLTGPFHVRFWHDKPATVDIKSVVLNQPVTPVGHPSLSVVLFHDVAYHYDDLCIGIKADSAGQPVVGVDIQLHFGDFELLDARPGRMLPVWPPTTVEGSVFKASFLIRPGTEPRPINGLLTTLRCYVPPHLLGIKPLTLLFEPGSTTDCNIVSPEGNDILTTVRFSLVTIEPNP